MDIERARESADNWVKEMRALYPHADPWQLSHASFLAGVAWKPGDVWLCDSGRPEPRCA